MSQHLPTAVGYRASGAILNPWYLYPVAITFGPGMGSHEDAPHISSPCAMLLPELALAIILGPRELLFASLDGTQRGFAHIEPIRQYTMYRTFLNFNIESIASPPDVLPEQVDPLRFTVRRLIRHETPIERGVAVHHSDVPENISISSSEIRSFLSALDRPLSHAIGFYLRADSPRYILAEYYKAFESIAEALGGVSSMVKALGPFGVTDGDRREFTHLCNDQVQSPTDLGRHAAKPQAPLRLIDMRDPFADPHFMAGFQMAAKFCRSVMDGYIAFRTQTGVDRGCAV